MNINVLIASVLKITVIILLIKGLFEWISSLKRNKSLLIKTAIIIALSIFLFSGILKTMNQKLSPSIIFNSFIGADIINIPDVNIDKTINGIKTKTNIVKNNLTEDNMEDNKETNKYKEEEIVPFKK